MSDIAGEVARIRGAFEKPTLRLLDRKWAPFVITVLQSSFSRERQSVQAEHLHVHVDACLAELRSVGEPVPGRDGRSLCMEWMNGQWLVRSIGEDGGEVYALTSHALAALLLVDSLRRDRALISESRLKMILQTARQWAEEANATREDRIWRLDAQIAQLTAERNRLAHGGEIDTASDERMADGYHNLVDLISQLPSDFKRVEEAVTGMHRKIIHDFREEEQPIGAVLDDYLARTDELMSATPEGRAFQGALQLLSDDRLLLDLKSDLQTILDHPFASVLTAAEQREFRGTVTVIRKGIDDVLFQRKRLSMTLREHIVAHDVIRERELEALFRAIGRQLTAWMETAGPRATVPVELVPGGLAVEQLRERFHDPAEDTPAPPLRDVSAQAPPAPRLEEIRAQGGPLLARTRDAVVEELTAGRARTLGQAFNAMNAELRRPVEILGLLHMAAQVTALDSDDAVEAFETVRQPGGVGRAFHVRRVVLNENSTAALGALDTGQDA